MSALFYFILFLVLQFELAYMYEWTHRRYHIHNTFLILLSCGISYVIPIENHNPLYAFPVVVFSIALALLRQRAIYYYKESVQRAYGRGDI